MNTIKIITKESSKPFISLAMELSSYYNGKLCSDKQNQIVTRCTKYIQDKTAFGYFINNTLVGYITVSFFDKDHHNFPNSIFLSELFVEEKSRGKGIGKELVKYILNKDFNDEYYYFSVTHSPKEKYLTSFYSDLGFTYDRILESGNIALIKNIPFDHIAILNKKWDLLPKIISGKKSIESRWYKYRFSPWNKIFAGDSIYFKNSGELVTVKATVSKVLQFDNLTKKRIKEILESYGNDICLSTTKYSEYYDERKYCILVFLNNVKVLDEPFNIDKSGFGNSTAWIVVKNVSDIKTG
jgi:GNAT superfamily N-acetyltransferase